MRIVGYHGTSAERAAIIQQTQKFTPSRGDQEQLGCGVYFYEEHEDARVWAYQIRKYPCAVVVSVGLDFDAERCCDFDLDGNKEVFETVKEQMRNTFKGDILAQKDGLDREQALSCMAATQIWECWPKAEAKPQIFKKSFPIYDQPTGAVDTTKARKELCIKDSACIDMRTFEILKEA